MDSQSPNLPMEIILQIVELLGSPEIIAVPANSVTSRSIRSCLTVCRAVYPVAIRLLYTHCLYIDTSDRLMRLLIAIEHHMSKTSQHEIHPDYDETHTTLPPNATTITKDITCANTTPPPYLPPISILPYMHSLYLAPFSPHTSIDDLPTATWIFELLSITQHTLRRLISCIRLSTVPPWQDRLDVRSWLRRGFEQLTALEEFICPYDDFDLTVTNQFERTAGWPAWGAWGGLRRLMLCDMAVGERRYAALAGLRRLEVLVVVTMQWSDVEWDVLCDLLTKGGRESRVTLVWLATAEMLGQEVGDLCVDAEVVSELVREWNMGKGAGTCGVDLQALVVRPWKGRGMARNGRWEVPLFEWIGEQALLGRFWDLRSCEDYRRDGRDENLFIDATADTIMSMLTSSADENSQHGEQRSLPVT